MTETTANFSEGSMGPENQSASTRVEKLVSEESNQRTYHCGSDTESKDIKNKSK